MSGIVKETVQNLKFSFNVENFTANFNKELHSEEFRFADGKWFVLVRTSRDMDYVGMFMYNKILAGPTHVNFKASFLVKDKILKTVSLSYLFEKQVTYGWPKLFFKNQLIEEISPHYSFTVVCEMKVIDDAKFHPSVELNVPSQLRAVCSYDFYDIVIKVKGHDSVLLGHRVLLSAYSSVLYEEIKKDLSVPLVIEDFSLETIQEVLNFIYDRNVNKTEQNVKEILLAAKKYKIFNLQMECEKFMFQKVTNVTAFATLIFAFENSVSNLHLETLKFVDKNIDVLSKNHTQWQQLVTKNPRLLKIIFKNFMLSRLERFEISITESSDEDSSDDDFNSSTNDFGHLYDTMPFSDLILEVGGRTLKAHKIIMWSRSTVFRAMFTHDSLESKSNRVKIIDFDYNTIQQLLKYMYCEKVPGLKENAINLFAAADKYDIKKLKNLCRSSMKQNITVDNITEILKLCDLHLFYLVSLKEAAMKFLKINFKEVCETVAWNNFAETNSRILSNMLQKILSELD